MAAMIGVSLCSVEDVPAAEAIAMTEGDYKGAEFIVLRFGADLSVTLPGFDDEAIAYARLIADALLQVARGIEKGKAQAAGDA